MDLSETPGRLLLETHRKFRSILIFYACVVIQHLLTLTATLFAFRLISYTNLVYCLLLCIGLCFIQSSQTRILIAGENATEERVIATLSLKDRQRNLVMFLTLYILNLACFIDQGICNIWGTWCPYITQGSFHDSSDDSTHMTPMEHQDAQGLEINQLVTDINGTLSIYQWIPLFASESSKDQGQMNSMKAGLLLLTAQGLSFVFNAWIVMSSTQLLHLYLTEETNFLQRQNSMDKPPSPFRKPASKFLKDEIKYDIDDCMICQNALQHGEQVHILDCKHIFHELCFNKWYLKGQCCPICRQEVENVIEITETKHSDLENPSPQTTIDTSNQTSRHRSRCFPLTLNL